MAKLASIEALLERQATLSDLRARMAREGRENVPREGPWITISRQLGSGGTTLGQRLADELGWRVFDREIVSTVARQTHTREGVAAWLDEHAIGPVTDYLARLMDSEIPGQLPYMQEMVRVIWALARQGDAIILGRGANWFLDPCSGLRLRITAPFDDRTARLIRDGGIDRTTAEKKVRENDTRQRQFIRGVFAREIDDPEGYDCILNTASLGTDAAVAAARTALRRKLQAEL